MVGKRKKEENSEMPERERRKQKKKEREWGLIEEIGIMWVAASLKLYRRWPVK